MHHEGLPGHHLQFVVTASYPDLHPWQRHLCHIHGYAEGWAHYAEQLADELGLIRDPAERLGLLLGQIWRSVRIVADIGLHTGWAVPAEHPRRPRRRGRPSSRSGCWSTSRSSSPTSPASRSTATSAGPDRRSRSRWARGSGTRRARPGRRRTATRSRCATSTATRWRSGPMGLEPLRAQLLGRSIRRRRAAGELRKHLAPEQRDALGGVDAVRRAELDAIHARRDEPVRLTGDVIGRAREREQVEHVARHEPPAPSSSPSASRARIAGSRSVGQLDGRIERRRRRRGTSPPGVGRAARAASPSRSTTVTAPSTTPTASAATIARGRARAADAGARRPTIAGFALPPTLTSSASSPARAMPSGPHEPIRIGARDRSTG